MAFLNLAIRPRFRPLVDGGTDLVLVDPRQPGWRALDWLPWLLWRPLGLADFSRVRRRSLELAATRPGESAYQLLSDAMGLRADYDPERFARIPRTGPLLVIANHPLAAAEAILLTALMARARPPVNGTPSVKASMANFFGDLPEFQPHAVFSDTLNPGASHAALAEMADWLGRGHVIVLFPAGDISFRRRGQPLPVDLPWKGGVAKLVREARPTVLPVYVHGQLSRVYYFLRRYARWIASALTLQQWMRQQGTTIRYSIGDPVPYAELEGIPGEALIPRLRALTYAAGGVVEP